MHPMMPPATGPTGALLIMFKDATSSSAKEAKKNDEEESFYTFSSNISAVFEHLLFCTGLRYCIVNTLLSLLMFNTYILCMHIKKNYHTHLHIPWISTSILLITVAYSYVVKYIIIIIIVVVIISFLFFYFVWTSWSCRYTWTSPLKDSEGYFYFFFLKEQLKTLQKPEEETKSNYLCWDSNPCCDAGTFLCIISGLSYVWKIIQRKADSQSCWENMYTHF